MADRVLCQIITHCGPPLGFLYDLLSGSLACAYRGATPFNRKKKRDYILQVNQTCRMRCLVSKVGLIKLTAKGEPQYENHSKAKCWRNSSKTFPVEQLHQAAVDTPSCHSFSILGATKPFSLTGLLNVHNQHSAFFSPLDLKSSYKIFSRPIELPLIVDLVRSLPLRNTHFR